MNASTVLMVIEIVRLLQAMKEDKELNRATHGKVINDILKGTPEEKALVGKAMMEVDPSFFAEVCDGFGDFVKKILGKSPPKNEDTDPKTGG